MEAEAQDDDSAENDWDAHDADIATFDWVSNVSDDVEVYDADTANNAYDEVIAQLEVIWYVEPVNNVVPLPAPAFSANDAVWE